MFGPYWWASWTMLTCNALVPQLLWFKRIRYSIPALWVISIFVNIGMWLEGYVIIVTSLHHGYEPFMWHLYRPSLTEMGILVGSFCWFLFWFMIFTRVVPPVAIAELKEGLPPMLRHRSREAHS
jgi:molybdopterin-containing oxidoreductase family membrane subunit